MPILCACPHWEMNTTLQVSFSGLRNPVGVFWVSNILISGYVCFVTAHCLDVVNAMSYHMVGAGVDPWWMHILKV